MEIKQTEAIIEAILFTMGESVELDKIADTIEHDKETTRKIIRNMMMRYEEEDREYASLNWKMHFSYVRSRKCMSI